MTRTPKSHGTRHSLFVEGVMTALAVLLVVLTAHSLRTNILRVSYVAGMQQPITTQLPLRLKDETTKSFSARLSLHVPFTGSRTLRISADDCLESIIINGSPVDDNRLPYCDYSTTITVDLSKVLRNGRNEMVMNVRNNGGDTGVNVEAADRFLLSTLSVVCCLILIAAYVMRIGRAWKWKPSRTGVWILCLIGAGLRWMYLLATPYWVRGHDTDGHIEYMHYLIEHLSLPPPAAGWEFWQPPLYYALGAVLLKIASFLGLSEPAGLFGVQVLSFILSVCAMVLIVVTAQRSLKHTDSSHSLLLVAALSATFPALILQSAVINNDTLGITLSLAALYALMIAFQSKKFTWWIVTAVLIALSILTKNTALLLLPVAGITLMMQANMRWREKIRIGSVCLLIITVLAGWFTAYRLITDASQPFIIGNNDSLNSGLKISTSVRTLTTFDPIAMIQIPYNNPWSDDARRQYFWEYWYRSAFFGEFSFGEGRSLLASWILLLGYCTILLSVIGIIRSKKEWQSVLPMLLLFVILPLGHLVFVIRYPFSSSEDFRYSIPFLLPFFTFVALGAASATSLLLRHANIALLTVFCSLCAIFLIHP